jgi:peptide/nickel transport system substrate-binding protein
MLMFRGLLSFGPDGQLQAELAEGWQRDGETGWVFHLRDAVFQSGAPVTAADVAWSIDQVRGEHSTAYVRGPLQGVQSVETPDPRTVRIVMKEPMVTLPLWMANAHMPVIERRSVESGGPPVGAGPYRLVSQERGVALELTAFDKFYKPGLPKMPRIRMVAYADENLRVAALKAGDVDVIEYVPWQSMQEIEANPRLRLDGQVGPFMNLLFNGARGPFKDRRVRLATAYAIRREEIVQAAFFGHGAPLGGLPIPPGTPFYDASLADVWHYDPDKAKSLSAEAGLPNGFSCTLLATAQYGMHKTTAEIVQQHLAGIGIQAKLDLPEWGQRVTLGNRGQYEIAVFGTSADSNDPDGMATALDGELPTSYGRSYAMPTPRIHALFDAGRREFDQAKRRAIYAELQQVALDQAPMVTLAWRLQAYGMSRKVQGFRCLPGALAYNSGLMLETTSIV